jgi:hypothetical protein
MSKSLPRALPATEMIDNRPTNEPEKIPHYTTASPDSRSTANQMRFPTRTGEAGHRNGPSAGAEAASFTAFECRVPPGTIPEPAGPKTVPCPVNLGTLCADRQLPGDCAVRINANAAKHHSAWWRCPLRCPINPSPERKSREARSESARRAWRRWDIHLFSARP